MGAHPGLRHWARGPGAAGADRISGRGNRILKAQLKGRLKLSDAEASSASAVAVTQLDGKWRMSQNRDMQDRDGVAKGLGQRGDGDDLEMAELVSRYIVPSG